LNKQLSAAVARTSKKCDKPACFGGERDCGAGATGLMVENRFGRLGVGYLVQGIHPMENWIWGLLLIALTMAIHGTGLLWIALADARIRVRIGRKMRLRPRHVSPFFIGLVALVGLLLAALHGIEAALWAAAYWWLGALTSPADAILYSIDSISTRGASGLILEHQWRLMGALEAVDGMLLFGISTAFVFTVMQAYWPLLTRRQ